MIKLDNIGLGITWGVWVLWFLSGAWERMGGRGGDSGALVWFLIRLKRVLESVLVFAALL